MSQEQKAEAARILRYPEVKARTGYHRTSLFKMERNGKFPKRVNLGPKSIGWLESEIEAWIAERVNARNAAVCTEESTTKNNSQDQESETNTSKPARKRGRPPVNPPQHPTL